MEWPIFYKDKLIVGNKKSPVAICTLWTNKEEFSFLPQNKFSVIGNLYTNYGINYIVKNILANPRIRCIVVCGKDLMKTGEALINFFKNGIDENYKIIGSNAYIDKSIPKNLIDVLRKNVKIVDLRNEEKVRERIEEIVQSYPEEVDLFIEPSVLEEREEVEENLTTDDVVFRVEGSIPEVWLKILDIVLKFGEVKETEYGIRQKEVLDVVAVITEDGEIPKWFPVSLEDLENYTRQFFVKEKPEGIAYTYGERLFALRFDLPEKVREYIPPQMLKEAEIVLDQIHSVIERLKSKRFTRRAIAVTWRHEIDVNSENPPCLIEIVWSIKNDRLYQTCTFRSHDIFGAWIFNVYALRKLQKDIAKELNVQLGSLIILSVSAHIYENNWKQAEELVEKYYRNRVMKFKEDPRGFFIVRVENGEIIVEHRLKDGRKSKYEFRGKKAEELYRRILNENLVSRLDHAAYLGKELARAEIALKEGKGFVQDKA